MNINLLHTTTGSVLSGGAQVLIAILPLASVIVLGILVFFYMRWEHQKRMYILQQGKNIPERKIDEKILLMGIVSFFVGTGLSVFFILHDGLSMSLLGGIIPAAAGAGIVTAYIYIHRKRE